MLKLPHVLRAENPDAPAEGSAPAATLPAATSTDTTLPPVGTSSDADPVTNAPDLAAPHAAAYEGFDPEKHRVGPDGKPMLTPTGRFAKKSKSGQSALVASTGANAPKTGVVGVRADNLPAAKQTINVAVNLLVRFFGPEWEPRDPKELPELAFALRDYFDARGVPQMPPEVVLLMAVASYALPRLNHENTKSRLAKIFQRVKDWRESLRKVKGGK